MTYLQATFPGFHPVTPICGTQYVDVVVGKFYYCGLTISSLVSSLISMAVTMIIVFAIVARLRSGVPGRLQLLFEWFFDYVRREVGETVAKDATFIVPLAATIGLYVAVANWIEFLPLGFSQYFVPANSDLNQTLALGVLVFWVVQWYSVKTLGWRGYFRRFTRPVLLTPFSILEEFLKPITLALRLFGNIFAGVLMIYLLSQLPVYISWFGVGIWKAFDVFFIGTIQALIFMLLTIVYFGMAREGIEEELERRHRLEPAPAPIRN
jgi:F-type H+-transporting ATPase subunit a